MIQSAWRRRGRPVGGGIGKLTDVEEEDEEEYTDDYDDDEEEEEEEGEDHDDPLRQTPIVQPIISVLVHEPKPSPSPPHDDV